MTSPVYKMGFIFFSGGGGDFWEVVVGVHRPPHLILALFQSNIRVPPPGFMSRKRTTFDLMKVLTHVTRGQPLNEDVFEVSVLRFIIVSFKRFYDEYLVGFFFTVCWSLNFWMIFSLPKCDANFCVFGVGVCVYTHWIKISLKLSLALFISPIFKRW